MTRTPIISLGGGVQSTALVLMAAHGEFDPAPPLAVFADPQGELPATYAHVEWLRDRVRELGGAIEVVDTTRGSLEQQLRDAATGRARRTSTPPLFTRSPEKPQGMVWRQCTRDFKIRVVRAELRRRGYGPKRPVESWIGYTVDEIERARTTGKDNPQWQTVAYPLLDRGLSRADCERWLLDHGYPIPPKSACVFCPYHNNDQWRDLRDNHPAEFARAVELDRTIRRGLPGLEGEAFLHEDRVPLDEVDLEVRQLSLGACDGNAGCFT